MFRLARENMVSTLVRVTQLGGVPDTVKTAEYVIERRERKCASLRANGARLGRQGRGLPRAVSQSLARGEDWVGYRICQHECSASWCGGLVVQVGASMASGRGAPAEKGNQILSGGPLNQVQGIKGLQQ